MKGGEWMNKITKGQEIWFWSQICGVSKTTVKSVGRKYITIKTWDLKFDKDTLREVNYRGVASFLILDIDKYRMNQEYKMKINKLKNIKWECVEREDFDKIYNILKDYD